MLKVQKKSTA